MKVVLFLMAMLYFSSVTGSSSLTGSWSLSSNCAKDSNDNCFSLDYFGSELGEANHVGSVSHSFELNCDGLWQQTEKIYSDASCTNLAAQVIQIGKLVSTPTPSPCVTDAYDAVMVVKKNEITLISESFAPTLKALCPDAQFVPSAHGYSSSSRCRYGQGQCEKNEYLALLFGVTKPLDSHVASGNGGVIVGGDDIDVSIPFAVGRQCYRKRKDVVAPCAFGPLSIVGSPSRYTCEESTISGGSILRFSLLFCLAMSLFYFLT